MSGLAILETHPVQYHAPVYRCLAQEFGVDVTVVYGSDFSVAGYRDKEFGSSFAWDTDLLGGVKSQFISRQGEGGAASYDAVNAAGLASTLRTLNPDAVMALGYHHPYDRAGLEWARRHGKPVLFRGETSDHALVRNPLKSWMRDWMLRRLYRRCSGLLYVGQRSRAHYERLGVPPGKLFFSPYCIDATTFQREESSDMRLRTEVRQKLGIATDAMVILFSGKLSERKGVDLIPQAVRRLPETLRERAHLLFLGDGALRRSLENDCQTSPRIPASFTGFQNQSSLSAYYHAADLLVLPSRQGETWGLVVNEALIHGLPCVVSDQVGSQPDLVIPGKTGAVCRTGSVSSLAEALAQVMQIADQAPLALACKNRVAAYSVRAAADGICQARNSLRQPEPLRR